MLCAGCLVGFSSLNAQPILHDTFDTLNTSVWTPYSSKTEGTVEVSGGNLVMQVGTSLSSHRNTLLSTATNFNPYGRILSITAGSLTLNAADSTSINFNSFYFLIGNAEVLDPAKEPAYYSASRTSYVAGDGYGAIVVLVSVNDSGCKITVEDIGSTYKNTDYTISGVPTDISFTLDGTGETMGYTLTLTGATFSDGAATTVSGSITHFTQTIDSADALHFALGDNNSGAVDVITNSTLGQIDVVQVPEPAASGLLLALAALFLAVRMRHPRA
jgi:hypothetical protein